jgi:hypothetical protein
MPELQKHSFQVKASRDDFHTKEDAITIALLRRERSFMIIRSYFFSCSNHSVQIRESQVSSQYDDSLVSTESMTPPACDPL